MSSYDMKKKDFDNLYNLEKIIKNNKKSFDKDFNKFVHDRYLEMMGIELNSKKPKTFNEKINYIKLDKKNYKVRAKLADKIKVKKYVKKKIGEKYLIPEYFNTKKLTVKQLEKLPNQFVLKANNGSGTNYIVTDKNNDNLVEICDYLNEMLKIKYGYIWGEIHYNYIKPRILAEKLLIDKAGNIPDDLKCFCFQSNDGERKKIIYFERVIEDDRYRIMFDENWKPLEINSNFKRLDIKIKKPKNYDEIMYVIDKLSEDFNFVRVDLFLFNDNIYFGELTFTPTAGYLKLDEKTDLEWGSYIGDKFI